MAVIVGHGGTAKVNLIANRTAQSHGSVGGVKKAGIFGGSVGWPNGNLGTMAFRRAPQRMPTNIATMYLLTTRRPTQGTGYTLSHGGLM